METVDAMDGMAVFLAWLGLMAAAYHFVGYPLLMACLAALRDKTSASLTGAQEETTPLPSVAMVIAAYNEEAVIVAKLRNSLALDYPPELLSVVVVADGSSDATAQIVRSFGNPRVSCMFDPARRGKGHALNRALAEVRADVVVLSDANNDYSANAIRLLVARLAEPGVGAVMGAKRIVESRERAASGGDGLYWKYESRIKTAESVLGGTVTGDGEIFAMRRDSYTPIPDGVVNDDLFLSLRLVARGQKIIYEPLATAIEEASMTIREDFRTKVRMIAGGLQCLPQEWTAICSSAGFAFKFFSHKILRWTMPVYLMLALVGSAFAPGGSLLHALFVAQLAMYGLAVIGWLLNRLGRRPSVCYVPFYFLVMNLAAVAAMTRVVRGGQTALWSKAAR